MTTDEKYIQSSSPSKIEGVRGSMTETTASSPSKIEGARGSMTETTVSSPSKIEGGRGSMTEAKSIDERYMRRALQLARQGGGHASPNPMVGAVVVHRGKIIGEGFHRCCGQGHAEVNAIASVRDHTLLSESTIYVTLEPCSHYGKTPPCAKLLIEKNIKRVVVGTLDPFEKVSGRGVQMLREAGVEVEVGILEQQCRDLNRRFFTAHTTGMPWVMLKWAQSSDGFLADENGAVQFSTPLTRALMHRERSMVDAIVVGANTVKIDNPSLTTRHWSGNSPLRVVLDKNLSMPSDCKLIADGGKTLIYNAIKNETKGSLEWVKLNTIEPQSWLRDLYRRGITSVMVEGGANVLQQMLDANAWNELRIEISPATLRKGIKAPVVDLSHTIGEEIDGNLIVRETR